MHNPYHTLFKTLDDPLAPPDLSDRIVLTLHRCHQRAIARRAIGIFLLGIILPFTLVAVSWETIRFELVHSSLSQFAPLLFTDPLLVVRAGNDFFLSIVETLPIFSLMSILALVAVVLSALRVLAREVVSFVSLHSVPS